MEGLDPFSIEKLPGRLSRLTRVVSARNSNNVVAVGVVLTTRAWVAVLSVPGSGTRVSVTLGWGGSSDGGQGGDGGDESESHCDMKRKKGSGKGGSECAKRWESCC